MIWFCFAGDDGQNSEVTSRFRAKINPCENTTAENELSRNLCKDAFLEMTPLGQFNLGFIIARHRKDLFIIDQARLKRAYKLISSLSCVFYLENISATAVCVTICVRLEMRFVSNSMLPTRFITLKRFNKLRRSTPKHLFYRKNLS